MAKALTFPAGRKARIAIVVAWVAAIFAIFGADLLTKFSDAENNESSSYLPGDAESTLALERTEQLTGGEQAAIVIAYGREGGLTAADRRRVRAEVRELNREVDGVSQPFEVVRSAEDGTGLLVLSSITATGEAETILDPVERVRELVSTDNYEAAGELQVAVTGPAGFAADQIEIFESIDATLISAVFALVFVLLILIYRSPILLWIPLLAVAFAEIGTRAIGFGLTELGVTINGQSSSILSVLVLGAGTDYALLLIARYREELRKQDSRERAMRVALRTAGPAILASGGTVIAALLCLALADLNSTASLGPIGAVGIATAMLSMLTFLPALLVLAPRFVFWPRVPHVGDVGVDATHGPWRRLGERIAAGPRRVWIGAFLVLGVMAVGMVAYDDGLTSSNGFRDDVEAVAGQELIERSFPGGSNAPTEIVVGDPARSGEVARAVAGLEGVADVEPVVEGEAGVLLNAVLVPDPYSTDAFDLIPEVRAAARQAGGEEVLVGGGTAVERDIRDATVRDIKLIVPLVLVVVAAILIVLLRALAAPLLLIGTVVVSFFAALGVSMLVSDVIFQFPGVDPGLALYAFVFLVALGIDYNIFLMTRVREETVKHGTREGMLRGLAVTGGVITAAGIVLAGTFSVLAVLPLVFLTQIGFTVAFGVLLDTFLVRSVLVPALTFEIGSRIWWPSALGRGVHRPAPDPPRASTEPGSG
jgi:putative drug exporter of the RND superfamily